MREVVSASPWLLMAGVGSVVVGFCHVVLRARLSGGGLGTVLDALRDRISAVFTILVIDFIAGFGAATVGAVAGASQPTGLVAFVNDHPGWGWLAVGIVGPLVSDRAFSGSIVRGRFDPAAARVRHDEAQLERVGRPDGSRVRDDAWRLRAESVKSIEMRVWVIVQRALGDEAKRLLSCVEDLYRTDRTKLARLLNGMRALDDSGLPSDVGAALQRALSVARDSEDLPVLLLALAQELIDAQIWEPIEALCPDPP